MAKSDAVWGIDIGQCALKALKCRPHEKDSDRIVVESFDYIEYPKILSQPEADPEEIVREALQQFLSRNDLTNDQVAMSVAGQSGLARFIKLPPVDSKKIPDIVKYEARQQIPFALEDVVWDYQQLTGGSEEDGFALEPEVGLFAMKRDQVARALEPLEEAGIEVDYIQLAPLAVYNYVVFDRMEDLRSRPYDPNDPPESTVVISLGTDTTDLVVTNGYRVWQRNIPIGGNHFTRALSKELKLTFVKAEHLKRNATQADDPKAVFQAMRPVFSDLLAEIQRSLGYFTSIDKIAKIGEVIALGNAMKLPGLQKYLSQNLEHDVKPIEDFRRLSGGSATARSQFKENVLSFAVAYGLCVQGLGKSELHTNLLPEEIVRTRLIRAKKPWAVAGVAAILLGLTFNYFTHVSAWSETQSEEMQQAESQAKSVTNTAASLKSENNLIKEAFDRIKESGENLVSNVEGRLLWLEVVKAVNAALPKDERPAEERKETTEDISRRNELHITAMDARYFEDLEVDWFSNIEARYLSSRGMKSGTEGEEEEAEESADEPVDEPVSLSGSGWVFQLTGYHYHNKMDRTNEMAQFVNNTLIKNLEEGYVKLPDGENDELVQVLLSDVGISHPWLVAESRLTDEIFLPGEGVLDESSANRFTDNRRFGSGDGPGEDGQEGQNGQDSQKPELIELKRYDFVVQFCWRPTPKTERRRLAEERRRAEAERVENAEGDELADAEMRIEE